MVIPGVRVIHLGGVEISKYRAPEDRVFSVLDRDASGKLIVRQARSKYVPEIDIYFEGDIETLDRNIAYIAYLFGVTQINERIVYRGVYPGGETNQIVGSFIID